MNEYTYQWDASQEEPILKITKSSFGSFQWCPKKYEFSYIERMPIDTTEAMIKGTVVHNSREDFFDNFDVIKAENMSHSELIDYNIGLHPVDEYSDMYTTISAFEAQRFLDAKDAGQLNQYLPVINEEMLDAEIVIPRDVNPKFPLLRDYTVHLQGIIDRMFISTDDNGELGYVPMELKTGAWKDYKQTSMRKELAFYKFLLENAPQERLEELGIDRNIPVSHWAWYYPASNYLQVEKVKKTSMKAVMNGIAQLIHAYERKTFPTKYFYKTCAHCSFFNICESAQSEAWV